MIPENTAEEKGAGCILLNLGFLAPLACLNAVLGSFARNVAFQWNSMEGSSALVLCFRELSIPISGTLKDEAFLH